MTLVLVDLDGTLLKKTSSERLFFQYLIRQRTMGSRQLTAFIWFFLRWFCRYGKSILRKDKAYLAGLRVADVETAAAIFVQKKLIRRICPVIKGRVDAHHRAGDETVLMTGTLEFIAKPLADTLGMDHVCATVCETLNDRFISAPPAVHPIGQEKLRLGKDLCRKLGYELSGCTAYGNSADDIPLLEAVSQPVAVYPAPRLRRVAIDRAWEIVG